MIRKNKTIAKIMVLALCANTLPCVNAFAAEDLAGDQATKVVAAERSDTESTLTEETAGETTTGAAVEVKDEEVNEDDFKFDEATGTITEYVGDSEKVVIPSEIKGVKVTGIGANAFTDFSVQKSVKEIILPDTIKSIGKCAFFCCEKLESINVPEGITEIPAQAFSGCNSLSNIELPDTLGKIDDYAFSGCSFDNINISKNVNYIGKYAFHECSNLKEVSIPEGVTEIGDETFYNCTSLNKVVLPKSVTKIGSLAFTNCSNAIFYVGNTEVEKGLLDNGIEKDKIKGNDAEDEKEINFEFDAATGTITKYVGATENVVIPSEIKGIKVTGIGEDAFSLSTVKEIKLPDTIKNIGACSFANCENLESINIPEGVTEVPEKAFLHCGNLKNIVLPDSITSIDDYAFSGCSFDNINISKNINHIGKYAFNECSNLKEVSIPEGVTEINDDTFYNCTSLNKVVIPKSVTKIGSIAFTNCSNAIFYVGNSTVRDGLIKNGIEKNKIKGIDAETDNEINFEFDAATGTITKYVGCSEKVVVPSEIKGVKVTGVAEDAFSSFDVQKTVKEITLPDTIKVLGQCAFFGCEKLESISIPEGVTEIPFEAFAKCTNLNNVTIPDSVNKIDEYAFAHCTSLEKLNIPGDVDYVGKNAFYNNNATLYVSNDNVKEKLLSSGVKEDKITVLNDTKKENVSNPADFNFDKKTGTISYYRGEDTDTLVIPDEIDGVKVTNIGEGAFKWGLRNIKKVVIPDNVTKISDQAFYYNDALEEVVLPDTLKSIGYDAFANCTNLKSIKIPESVTEIGDMAFGYDDSLESAEVPGNVSKLGSHTFFQCKNLKNVTIDSGITKVTSCMLCNCSSLENVTLPDSIKEIKYAAFDDVNPNVKIHVTSDAVEKLLLRNGIKQEQIVKTAK